MLSITDQREIIIDRLVKAMRRAEKNAKFSRNLKLYDHAKKFYYQAGAYKKALAIVKLIEQEPNSLTFDKFPFL